MKTPLKFNLIASCILLAGCATQKNLNSLDAVGPAPSQALRKASPSTGTLVVYSAFSRNADFNRRDPNRPEYSDYEIATIDGKVRQRVHNNTGTISQDAVPVTLPVGKYLVKARANGCGFVTVPVIIGTHRSTILHLEGGSVWPDASTFNQTNAVHLPDGRVVGWKAAADF